ncbi:MAG: hypothetical protein JXQ91_14910 [Vannielia sp.]|uniref:hypothetical protein n=1 Tax=Vannielia sp. TaxID=2813045 RepID=UPI003B8D4EDE
MIRGGLAVAAVCAAQGAGAACPVPGDLARGIRLVLTSGDTEVFRSRSEVLVESLLDFANEGGDTRFLYARGVYLLESAEVKDGVPVPDTRATFALPMRPEQTPEPLPGHGWGVEMVANYGDGPVREMLGVRYGTPGEVEIGGCTLAVLPMEQRIYEDGELVAREERHFLPGLGFSYPLAWHEEDRVDRYSYVTIEVME